MRFFFYGTLLDGDVASLVLDAGCPPAAYVPAALPHHARRRVRARAIRSWCVTPERGEGRDRARLSVADVSRLAAYEGPRYRIAPLKVRIDGR
jgi:hypothetical protein